MEKVLKDMEELLKEIADLLKPKVLIVVICSINGTAGPQEDYITYVVLLVEIMSCYQKCPIDRSASIRFVTY